MLAAADTEIAMKLVTICIRVTAIDETAGPVKRLKGDVISRFSWPRSKGPI
jgi:hypothetical protein